MSVAVTPNPVSERESVQLQIVVDSPLSTVVVEPSFDAPDFVQTGTRDMKFQPHDGDFGPNTRKRLLFTYVLMPRRAGNFFVRNIRTKAGGRELTSPDMPIKVTPDAAGHRPAPQPQATRPGGDEEDASNPASPYYQGGSRAAAPPSNHAGPISVPDRFNSDFTVWVSPSKTKAYVGEPIVVEYYLYDFGGLRQTEVLQWPTFNGFWKEDLELSTQVAFQEVYVKQQEVRRAFIARYALYGIKPGKFTVGTLGIRGKYAPSDSLSPGIMFGFDLRTGQHYSQELKVDILPLPEAGRPANFGGAVGKFRLKLEADKTTLAQNTPVTFTFTLEGTGNFQAIDSIKLPLPPDFELYESTASGRQTAPVGVRQELESRKTFQVVAIPRKAGKFDVPAASWSFFNTEKESYEKIATAPIQIEVTPNDSTATSSNTYLSPKAAAPNAQSEDLRYLKPLDASAAGNGHAESVWLNWSCWGLLALNLALVLRKLRGRTKSLAKLVKGIDRFSEARIALLQTKGIRDGNWQAGLEEVVYLILQVLLDTNPRGLTKHDLEEAWKARSLPAPLFQRIVALLQEIDRHRFSSQKLAGSGSQEVRSRFTKEAESLLSEASQVKRK